MRNAINADDLAARLREKRRSNRLSVRQAAREAGVSHVTLSRILRGNQVPEQKNLLLLARWLGVSVEELSAGFGTTDDSEPQQDHEDQGVYTPETVARLLRSDRRLKPADVEILMVAFRAMYDSLLARNEDRDLSERATLPLNAP